MAVQNTIDHRANDALKRYAGGLRLRQCDMTALRVCKKISSAACRGFPSTLHKDVARRARSTWSDRHRPRLGRHQLAAPGRRCVLLILQKILTISVTGHIPPLPPKYRFYSRKQPASQFAHRAFLAGARRGGSLPGHPRLLSLRRCSKRHALNGFRRSRFTAGTKSR
jgi:hypothetical protein